MSGRRPTRADLLPVALVALVAAAGSGCTRDTLQSEWDYTRTQLEGLPLELVDAYPADGATGIGHEIQPYFLFNRPLDDEERARLEDGRLVDLGGGTEQAPSPDLEADRVGFTLPLADLRRNHLYELTVPLPTPAAAPTVIRFETADPTGELFNMSAELDVVAFGGNGAQAQTLNDTFVPGVYPLWVLQVEGVPSLLPDAPVRVDVALAPARLEESDPAYFLRRDYGMVGRLAQVSIRPDGVIDHRQDGVFLPLWSGADVILLYLADVHLQGTVQVDGGDLEIQRWELTGVLTTRWLLRLAELGGAWRTVVDLLEPDVDTNGNGVDDSATFHIVTAPRAILADQVDL